MPSGLSARFDILQKSPHDLAPPPEPAGPAAGPDQHWVPSRYNIRATAEDGRLVLWNTLSGKMTTFKPEDRERVLGLLQPRGLDGGGRAKQVVGYLVERGYLVRKGIDEYRQFQRLFGEQHYRADALELILLASEDCNFRCHYCYEDFKRGTMIPAAREGLKNLVRKRIKRLNRLTISWFGGEPLYGWEAIEDLAPFFADIAAEHEVPYSGAMTTNGYLLTPEAADKLLAWRVRNFQITLDGLADHHDHSRTGRDGSPTFDRIFNNLKAMAQRDDAFRVLLRVNFDQQSAGGLSQFVDVLAEEFRGDARFSLSLKSVGKWGGPNDDKLETCTDEDATRIQRDILAQARRQGLHFGSLRDAARMGGHVCYAARPFNFVIGATGKVMKCTIVLDKDDYNVVGQLTPEGDLHLDDDRMGLWTEPAFEQDGQCRKCVVLPSCQGISCPLVRIQSAEQPCISARKNPKGELLAILDAPGVPRREVTVKKHQDDASGAVMPGGSSPETVPTLRIDAALAAP